jgi:cytochrome c556
MVLAAALLSVTAMTVGVAVADDEDSPLHKLMEKVNAKKATIFKGVRTPVAFKKAQKDVVASAEELVNLAKQTREDGEVREEIKKKLKQAKDVSNPEGKWKELMDHFSSSAEELAKVAGKPSAKQEEAKAAYNTLNKNCTECHNVFRVEEN